MGRGSFESEIKTKNIIDKSLAIIGMALERKSVYKNLSIETVVDLAKHFAIKAIPDPNKNDNGNTRQIIYIINPEKQTGNPLEVLPASFTVNNPQKQLPI